MRWSGGVPSRWPAPGRPPGAVGRGGGGFLPQEAGGCSVLMSSGSGKETRPETCEMPCRAEGSRRFLHKRSLPPQCGHPLSGAGTRPRRCPGGTPTPQHGSHTAAKRSQPGVRTWRVPSAGQGVAHGRGAWGAVLAGERVTPGPLQATCWQPGLGVRLSSPAMPPAQQALREHLTQLCRRQPGDNAAQRRKERSHLCRGELQPSPPSPPSPPREHSPSRLGQNPSHPPLLCREGGERVSLNSRMLQGLITTMQINIYYAIIHHCNCHYFKASTEA